MKYIIFIVTAIFVLLSGVIYLPVAYAGSYSSINNSVSIYSSSGGNVVSGKSGLSGSDGVSRVVISGSSETDVYIKTVVNGEVVQYVDEHYESQDEEGVEVEKEFHYQSEDGGTEVNTNINIKANSGNETDKSIDMEQTRVLSYASNDKPDKEIKDNSLDNSNNKSIMQPESGNLSKPDPEKRPLILSIVYFFEYVFSIFTK